MEKASAELELIKYFFPSLSNNQIAQIDALGGLYREWNTKINIVSRQDINGIYERHILHSMSIGKVFSFGEQSRVLDLGTGGGFPGIPLAILFPETHFHLIDGISKKIKVVDSVAQAIGLRNVTTEQRRAEEMKNQCFEVVLSRAVASLTELIKWSAPLLRPPVGTRVDSIEARGLICLKGGDLRQEIGKSGALPRVVNLFELFPRPFFSEKYILQILLS